MQIPISVLPLYSPTRPTLTPLPPPLPSTARICPRSSCCCFSVILLRPRLVSITLSSPSTLLVSLLLFVIRCEFSVPYLSMRAFIRSLCWARDNTLHQCFSAGDEQKFAQRWRWRPTLSRQAINSRNAINIPSVLSTFSFRFPFRGWCRSAHNYQQVEEDEE